MKRRQFVGWVGMTGIASLAGCTQRVTGWSSLEMILANRTEEIIQIEVKVQVDGTEKFVRKTKLESTSQEEFTASIDVPWGSQLTFDVNVVDSELSATEEWDASIPLWGGNKCMIEPAVTVESEEISITPSCL